jgi:secondary thiamine-phosphate synthase enzyme
VRSEALTLSPRSCHRLEVVTTRSTEFIDLTDRIAAIVRHLGLEQGIVHVQTRHTTTGLLVNEAEPRLLEDLAQRLACWAPLDLAYAHDDLSRRAVNITGPRERRNGHAHCRAALLRSTETVIVEDGCLALGRWQRVLFAEFDGPQRREVQIWLLKSGC